MTTLLTRGGQVIDGTGAPARQADVLVCDGRIAAVGPDLVAPDARAIHAEGAYVTPGFIDSHSHYDPSLFWDPLTEMAQHVVTSVLIGNCSLGLAPVHAADRNTIADVFAFIEDVPREAFTSLVPWNWETYGEYLDAVRRRPLSVHVDTLVGHSMLRQYVMGTAAWERAATPEECDRIVQELRKALRAGALGLSTSFFDHDSHGREVPTFFADDAEFDRLFEALGQHGTGLCQMIPRHPVIADVCADFARLGRLAARHGVRLLSNDEQPGPGQGGGPGATTGGNYQWQRCRRALPDVLRSGRFHAGIDPHDHERVAGISDARAQTDQQHSWQYTRAPRLSAARGLVHGRQD